MHELKYAEKRRINMLKFCNFIEIYILYDIIYDFFNKRVEVREKWCANFLEETAS